jgi:hypothetical protein
MSALDRKPPEHGEAVLQAYLRGSALLQDLDDLGLHQAAAHLSLALDIMDRNASLRMPLPSIGGGSAPWSGVFGQGG